MKSVLSILTSLSFITAFGQQRLKVEVRNELDFERKEIVGIKTSELTKFLSDKNQQDIRISDGKQNLVLQWIDNDSDGASDELLFQADVKAKSKTTYTLFADVSQPVPTSAIKTFSRFVPERTDDYAWENDKVAFRTYGPDAQRRVEQKLPNGTLSSGIDVWLKRTEKPVIDKWYAGYASDGNFYHKDRGEGYDPYHVGGSRGTGGSGIWINDSLEVSKNFIDYKTIATGPLRTVFELEYAPWGRFGISETKRISLDLGSNFSKFEVSYRSGRAIPNYTVGITLHDGKGQVETHPEHGWFRYAETIDGTLLCEGIVVKPKLISESKVIRSGIPDADHILILLDPNKKIEYFAGFAWAKSDQIKSVEDWDKMLKEKARCLASPLTIVVLR
ncbi:DUF4861 family protein [Flavobacterium sp. MAH-1]|uniref:DUF4861 family protein n=1 Tax=Flavobacterium agri TaxID=2743471 RepID=A0A7Y8Y478_9FLAO|nr:DUF4861 family protein [Flavobacterium agri]NUY82198.1 DUF4861 family protein [Flavobacterium agri]NYA72222.1 DUF4861 family protein [Flavobacterium agri]